MSASTPELVIRTPDGKSRVIAMDKDRYALGRSSSNDLSYADDSGLSRQHLAIERHGHEWGIRDLGSKNGTVVNGVRLNSEMRQLRPGDRISAGHLILEYTLPKPSTGTVVFVERAAEPITAATTVAASLEGLMGAPKDQALDPSKTQVFSGTPQMRALIRAGRELASHRPLKEVFQVIMDLSMEAVAAGRGVLMTLEGEELILQAARGEGFQISSVVRDRVLRERASLLVRDTSLEEAFRERKSIVAQQIRSMIAVPLQTNDRVIGLIYLDSPNLVRPFTREDLNLLTVMANVAAIRIEHARLAEVEEHERYIHKELQQAQAIQRNLLPQQAPQVEGWSLAGYNAACRTVGGDYYDFLRFPGGKIGMLVADVSGKGLPASLIMTSVHACVQVLFEDSENLAAKLARLNNAVTRNCPTGKFVTFFMSVLDPATGEFRYSNAGHNPALVVRRDGRVEKLDQGGMVLGMLPGMTFEEAVVTVDPGDIVVLYSDGVTESFDPTGEDEFGEDRLAATVYEKRHDTPENIVTAVTDAVSVFTAGAPAADDFTLLVARRDA
jgi:serine phosphatase RsbU (regulator of sigma subunit)